MASPPPPTPPPPGWTDIDEWLKADHEPSEEGPAASLSENDTALLVDTAVAEAKKLTTHRFKNHWPDFLVIALLALFVAIAVLQQFRYAPVDQLIVNAPGGLPAFHVLTDSDLVVRKLPPRAGAIAQPPSARGRFLLQYVPQGAALRDAQLSRTRQWDVRLKGLSVLQLPVRIGPADPSRETNVTLIASPRNGAAPAAAIIKDVPLLSIRRTNTLAWATVALSTDQLEALKPLLGASDIFIARETSDTRTVTSAPLRSH